MSVFVLKWCYPFWILNRASIISVMHLFSYLLIYTLLLFYIQYNSVVWYSKTEQSTYELVLSIEFFPRFWWMSVFCPEEKVNMSGWPKNIWQQRLTLKLWTWKHWRVQTAFDDLIWTQWPVESFLSVWKKLVSHETIFIGTFEITDCVG